MCIHYLNNIFISFNIINLFTFQVNLDNFYYFKYQHLQLEPQIISSMKKKIDNNKFR